jgi:hypothetical protein
MLNRKKLKKSDYKKLLALLEEHARAEVMARIVPLGFPDFTNYATMHVEKMDEIREFVFGTSCLVQLGRRWDMVKDKSERKKKKGKKKRRKK